MAASLSRVWKFQQQLCGALPAAVRDALGNPSPPRSVALRVAHETLSKFPKHEAPVLLDPCCASGAMLLAAIEWATVQRPAWIKPWLTQSRLMGWESVTEAAEVTRKVLSAAGKELGIQARPRVHATDALMTTEREIAHAVILYPPWREYAGAGAHALAPDKRAWFARTFGSFAAFPALHGAFTELAGKLVKPRGGRVGVLLPYKVADRPEYAGFRRALAGTLAPEQIVSLGDKLPAPEEPAMLIFTAGKGDVSGAPWQSRADANEQVYQSSIMRHGMLPPATFQDIGINPGNAAHLLIATSPEAGAQPLRDAADVHAWRLGKPRQFLRMKVPQASGYYAKLPPPAAFKQAVIVIRRDAGRPIAARHTPPAFFRDDVIACMDVQGHDPDFLLAVFNSEYFARLYRDSFRQGKLRAEGRITVEQLSALPMPTRRAAGKLYEPIVRISQELQKNGGANPKLLATLDEAVRRVYQGK